MINFHKLDNTALDANNQTAYMRYRYDLILAGEGTKAAVYLDTHTPKLPTIGIGYNLTDDNILDLVLKAFGVVTPKNSALFTTFHDIIQNAVDYGINPQVALDAEINWLNGLNPPQANRTSFTFSSGTAGVEEMRAVFDEAVKIYDNPDPLNPGRVDKWLADIPPSQERAVLASLSYNGFDFTPGKLKTLHDAVVNGNRVVAWYEIAFRLNAKDVYGAEERFRSCDNVTVSLHSYLTVIGRVMTDT